MSDLFKKLNTLVKAKVRDVISLDTSNILPNSDRRLERDARRLRERINEAIEHEDTLQARVDALRGELTELDQRIDTAVGAEQEETARQLIRKLTETQRRLEFAEADLRQHRQVAEDLIRQVNMMEAAIADMRMQETESQQDDPAAARPDGTTAQGRLERFNTILNQAQESLNRLRDKAVSQIEQDQPDTDSAVGEAEVEANIEARRRRLSGPPKDT